MDVNLLILQMDLLALFVPVQEPGPINLHTALKVTVSKTQTYIHIRSTAEQQCSVAVKKESTFEAQIYNNFYSIIPT